ncbi:hypothetical protein EYZ11_001744 [Aspergillus tanneri]|uniref:Uncharacterized protein n=1 Tax=Aspergillus tanneri TaxID=1220188 RepID=A0A4S3JT07_9EURO|nr:hypothetical protein EYZ11_001744 [Aspergillus tanneri]
MVPRSRQERESERKRFQLRLKTEFFHGGGQLPPEHCLADAEGLDVCQPRWKRYSNGTQ